LIDQSAAQIVETAKVPRSGERPVPCRQVERSMCSFSARHKTSRDQLKFAPLRLMDIVDLPTKVDALMKLDCAGVDVESNTVIVTKRQ